MIPTVSSRARNACAREIMLKQFQDVEEDALERMSLLSNYHLWVYRNVSRHVGLRVMDVGCGIGNFAVHLQNAERSVVLVDRSERHLEVAIRRARMFREVHTLVSDLDAPFPSIPPVCCDTFVCLDVLEHLAHDGDLLARLFHIAGDGARLIVKVPACPFLYSGIDRATGHVRRYTERSIVDVITESGWTVGDVQYMNMAGIAAYWFKSRAIGHAVHFSRSFYRWQLSLMNHALPLMRIGESLYKPPIGLSLIAIAQKE